jgi:hypothetical protein
MTKNPKSKKNFIGNLKKLIAPGETYIFPQDTKMNLYYYGDVVENTMLYIEHVKGKNSRDGYLCIATKIDGYEDWDDLMEFSYSEIKKIYEFICKDITAAAENRIVK